MSSGNYHLIIAAYTRGKDWRTDKYKPYHWALFICTGPKDKKDVGIAHQLHGMPGNFYYIGPEDISDLSKSTSKCLEVDIGSVPSTELDAVNWTIAAVKGLKSKGFIDSWVDEAYMRGSLKEVVLIPYVVE